jgi:hypothetical protein
LGRRPWKVLFRQIYTPHVNWNCFDWERVTVFYSYTHTEDISFKEATRADIRGTMEHHVLIDS